MRENLVNSFPEKSITEIIKIEKEFYRHFSILIAEIVKMSSISKSELTKRVKFNNLQVVEEYIKRGESVLACTGHYHNWEWGMIALGIKLPATGYVIYKPLNNTVYDNWFYKIRTRFGNSFIPMRQTLRAMASTRNEATMFCFASDQTPVRNETHYWINFLNQQTPVLLGIEKIALQTNRPVIYFKMNRIRKGYYEVDCHVISANPSETEEYEITNKSFKLLEEMIKKEPAYWLWSHRRWKHKPQKAI